MSSQLGRRQIIFVESLFTVHTANEVLETYRDGEAVDGVPMPTRRAPRQSPQFEEPVFVEHEPVISHQHRNETRRYALLI